MGDNTPFAPSYIKRGVGGDIINVCKIRTCHKDGSPSLVISCMADYVGGEIKLQEGEADDFKWVTLEEAKNYELLDGIYDELVMTEKKRQGEKIEWKRF